jgi:hypothetical protein
LGILPFALILIIALSSQPLAATAPPTTENAYCGKGNVPQFGGKDGPAELPKTCYYTALDGTPSPGKQIHVGSKENLADAVGHAQCGDILLLPAGTTYEVGELPYKKCDERHYITIRTDTPDSKLPPEGTRISPAWAGVASLPGRPPFAQPPGGAAKLMATLLVKRNAGAVAGDHVRFIGIEWTTRADTAINRIVSTEHGDHIIFDRNWVHPGDDAEVAHGIGMPLGSHFIGIINSYVSGLNCVAVTGKCIDATAIGGAHSDDPFGTFKIYDNFLEASGEDILFGGGPSENNPTDLEIRRNHLFRPMNWRQGDPGFTPSPSGRPFIVKNNLELKSAVRVLIEANLFENSWGGFSQRGFSILLTAASQGSHCPKCRVTDVTMRYNRVRNVAGVFAFATNLAPQKRGGGSPEDGGRFSIHDFIADNIHQEDYNGGGTFLKIASATVKIHDVQIDHVTSFTPGALLVVVNRNEKMPNFSITNSVLTVGGKPQPVFSGGPRGTCGVTTQRLGPQAVFDDCFSNYKFDHNLLSAERGGWPKENTIVSSPKDLAVRDLKDGISKDPRLCHEKTPGCDKKSPGAAAATDVRDLGADVDAVEAAVAGVE